MPTSLDDVNAALGGRIETDVPVTDEYWKVVNRYRFETLKKKYIPPRRAGFEREIIENDITLDDLPLDRPEHPIVEPPFSPDFPDFPQPKPPIDIRPDFKPDFKPPIINPKPEPPPIINPKPPIERPDPKPSIDVEDLFRGKKK